MNTTTKTRKARQGDRRKAIGVIRVSTNSQKEIGAAGQRKQLVKWAEREGVELVDVFYDIGISGEKPVSERPGLLAAIAALKDARAGILVATKRDRFARHRHVIADVERHVLQAGGVLVTCDGMCDGTDSEAEEVNSTISDLMAAMELRRIKSRNRDRAQTCISQGRTHGGRLPYGQRRKATGTTGRSGIVVELEPDPKEQMIIVRMVELRREGCSYQAIADILADEGITSKTGKKWQLMPIKRILDREAA